jgi:hypothetical protein
MSCELAAIKNAGKLEEYGYTNWKDENKSPYTFNLALPFVVFFLAFNNSYECIGGKVFFRTQPISGFSDIICKPPFLNISSGQTICFGDNIHRGPKRSIFADVSHAISSFWSSTFNPDYLYNYVAYQETPILGNYLEWQYYSHKNPMFIYNADWIKVDDCTVGTTIDGVRDWITRRDRDREDRTSEGFNFSSLSHLFCSTHERDLEKIPGFDNTKEPIIYDISQYIYLEDFINLVVGDSFKDKNGKRLFVNSFLGFRRIPAPIYINIQTEEGKTFRIKINSASKKFIANKIKEERFISTVEAKNGEILKCGDIIILNNKFGVPTYRKILYLRKSADGLIEGRFGSDYYIVDNLPSDVKVLDMTSPTYNGIDLKADQNYFVTKITRFNHNPIIPVAHTVFKEVTTGRNNTLLLHFTETKGDYKGNPIDINMNSDKDSYFPKVYTKDMLKPMPPVFRFGKKLMCGKKSYTDNTAQIFKIPNLGIAVPSGVSLSEISSTDYINQLIQNDTFKLESWDLDLEFKIGDKVVVSNWENPIDMLSIKQIQGFVTNKYTGDISFTVADKNEKIYNHKYIDGQKMAVHIGTIRKITNRFGDLSSGMKITAHTPGVQMFPKKDTNIIIGFFTDTGGDEPLVLCSNACTLWYSDVKELFNIIPMSDKSWSTKPHVPITPSKMRIQAGDNLQCKSRFKNYYGYIAYRPRGTKSIRALHLSYYNQYEESYVFDKYFTAETYFDGFPNPRMSPKQEEDLGFVNAFPNFHGMYTQTSQYHSPYLFHNDKRSILNVSDSSK